MDPDKIPSSQTKTTSLETVKVIEWEDFEQELARLWSLSSALKEANEKKESLQQKLEALIQVDAESLSRLNELEEMREKLEARKMVMEKISMNCMLAKEDARKQEERLSDEVRSLLVAGTNLSLARKRLQESNRLLLEEKYYFRLRNSWKMLRMRQQYMMLQISMLYPVKIVVGPSQEQELEAFPSGSKVGGNPNENSS
ncbi:UV radiation resistance-associated protein [Quillaja saponaria]|uniref:UV radiation resistance-associated protein n=1 Tax=Quillaja saponaria TaxID=32244 RepID=A0AAD7LML8_QUISA|nr:UV radiation resistance-associated protein [Quillaja saponaria]